MTMKSPVIQRINQERLIVSVLKARDLERAAQSDVHTVFLLTGNIGVLKRYVDFFTKLQKSVFLHLEKIGGLSNDREGLTFLLNHVKPAGIISTKGSIIRLANKMNMITIQRIFMIDSESVQAGIESLAKNQPDIVEIMPARIPELIPDIRRQVETPIITGGLITNLNQIHKALEAGAMAVSLSNPELWDKLNVIIKQSRSILQRSH